MLTVNSRAICRFVMPAAASRATRRSATVSASTPVNAARRGRAPVATSSGSARAMQERRHRTAGRDRHHARGAPSIRPFGRSAGAPPRTPRPHAHARASTGSASRRATAASRNSKLFTSLVLGAADDQRATQHRRPRPTFARVRGVPSRAPAPARRSRRPGVSAPPRHGCGPAGATIASSARSASIAAARSGAPWASRTTIRTRSASTLFSLSPPPSTRRASAASASSRRPRSTAATASATSRLRRTRSRRGDGDRFSSEQNALRAVSSASTRSPRTMRSSDRTTPGSARPLGCSATARRARPRRRATRPGRRGSRPRHRTGCRPFSRRPRARACTHRGLARLLSRTRSSARERARRAFFARQPSYRRDARVRVCCSVHMTASRRRKREPPRRSHADRGSRRNRTPRMNRQRLPVASQRRPSRTHKRAPLHGRAPIRPVRSARRPSGATPPRVRPRYGSRETRARPARGGARRSDARLFLPPRQAHAGRPARVVEGAPSTERPAAAQSASTKLEGQRSRAPGGSTTRAVGGGRAGSGWSHTQEHRGAMQLGALKRGQDDRPHAGGSAARTQPWSRRGRPHATEGIDRRARDGGSRQARTPTYTIDPSPSTTTPARVVVRAPDAAPTRNHVRRTAPA